MKNWYEPLRPLKSRGSTAARPGSLAGLAQARREHGGQFFTPDAIAALMWRIVKPSMHATLEKGWYKGKISVLDNSAGSGRLLQFADPRFHSLFGVDVDGAPIQMLGEVAEAAGFECVFENCGIEDIDPVGFDLALINPPFSVHIDAPTVQPYPCTAYGRYGPHSATLSHPYALAQALKAAPAVVALLPRTFVDAYLADAGAFVDEQHHGRLRLVLDLPARSFSEEGTDVSVSLLVFGAVGCERWATQRITLQTLEDELPEFGLLLEGGRWSKAPMLNRCGIEGATPSITVPVTGNRTVKVVRDGRRVKLRYSCGLTMAKVENAILRAKVTKSLGEEQRFPRGVRYEGQGVLDLEVHLIQDNPRASFDAFVEEIRAAGGVPEVDPGLYGYLRRATSKTRRQRTPMRHTVFVESGMAGDGNAIKARPRRPQVADPKVWGSPALSVDKIYRFERIDDRHYQFEAKGQQFQLTPEMLFERFEVVGGAAEAGWQVVHEGLPAAYPQIAQGWRSRAIAKGIDKWLSWRFQFEDLIELSMSPKGAVAAWDMGLGKARLAIALILLHECRHGLIVVEAGLLDEMLIELKGLPIAPDAWQVITRPEHAMNLRQVNVISYERLRLEVRSGHLQPHTIALPEASAEAAHPNVRRHSLPAWITKPHRDAKRTHRTYAGLLRRRCGVAVFDEGDLLSNPDSDQSRACAQLSPKKRYVLSGTPQANYPRDIAPVIAHAAGDGTAAQPWGWRGGKLEEQWRETMNIAERGVDAFRNTFVCTEWVTREFEDTLTEGAKREIPRIANLDAYRMMLAPHVKRRIIEEPEVAAWIKIPKESREIVDIDWDPAHLAYYLEVAEDFASYYQQQMRGDGKFNSLIAILAKIRAVSFACDYPQHGVDGFGAYTALTSKQRWAIDELERLTAQGKKTILYTENPGQVELIVRELSKRGVDAMPFHGGMPIKRRTRMLNERFRYGPCPNLVATLGVTQKGLNLWQAEEEILLSRSWSATAEEQAIRRALRPQQTKNVRVRYPMLRGSIDYYKAQLVDFKRDAARAGLDWGTPETENTDFLHLSTVIGRFVEDRAKLHGVASNEVRNLMARLAAGRGVEHV